MAHKPLVSSATVLTEPIIAITINATIRPYSTAVAPELSLSSALNNFVVFIVVPPVEYGLTSPISQKVPNERFPVTPDLQKNPTWMPVVAAALCRQDGRLLLYQRPEGKHHAGLWEFPGGKVEASETPVFALIREIKEELGLTLDGASIAPFFFAESVAGDGHPAIVILLYKVTSWGGEPAALEGGDWGWFTLDEAEALEKPPLDVELLAAFRASAKRAG